MKNAWLLSTVFVIAVGAVSQASASPMNESPPAGPVIFDLNGTPVPHSFTPYSTTFVAADAVTNLSFAFREDPAFLHLDNVTLTTGGGPNLVVNGDFEAGPIGGSAPSGWTYLNIFGASAGGQVASECGVGGGNCYSDGAVQAYDSITQAIATLIGSTYTVTFSLTDTSGLTTFSALSTNGNVTGTGGNGIDLLVYAGALPTPADVPEPATLTLLGASIAGFGLIRRRRKVT